jgi:hypothetical protein
MIGGRGMAIPDWARAYERPGTEVREISGNYYLYEVKGKWDKVKKRPKKVTGAYLGAVKPGGVVAPKKRVDRPVYAVEYGASALCAAVAGDLVVPLRRLFGEGDGEALWALAMLNLASRSPFRRMNERYESSWVSRMLPGLALSPASITALLDRTGAGRAACAAFMREAADGAPYVVIDGTRTVSASANMGMALPGHSRSHGFMPQVNQVYVLSHREGHPAPAFYRNVPGNVPDVSAFKLTIQDAQVRDAVLLADAGFASNDNFEDALDAGLDYVVPLRRNTAEVSLASVAFDEVFTYRGRAISAHMQDRGGHRICVFRDERMRAKEMSDLVSRVEKANLTARARRRFDPDRDLRDAPGEVADGDSAFGVIVIRTSLRPASAQEVYLAYKMRWEIEELFDTMRNACEADASYMHDDTGFEAWSFINHVTLIGACRVLAMLRGLGQSKEWSLEGVMEHLSHVRLVQIADEWRMAETTDKTRKLCAKLGIGLDLRQDLLPKR